MIKTPEIETLLTDREVGPRLRLHKTKLSRLRKSGRLGHYLIGKRVYYSQDQITDFLKNHRIDADFGH